MRPDTQRHLDQLLREFRARAWELREMEAVQFEESLGRPVSRERREFARSIEAAIAEVAAVRGHEFLQRMTEFLRRVPLTGIEE